MNKLVFNILASIIISSKLIGQSVEPSSGVEKNVLQFEFETLYSIERNTEQITTSWSIPNILIRYGLSDNIELQFHSPFTKERCFENNELTSNVFSFKEAELGFSLNLWKQNKLRPETALMVRFISATDSFSFDEIGNMVSLNFSNSISNQISLGYNIGAITNIDKNTTGFYVLNIAYEPNSQIHFFIENTANFNFDNLKSNCLGLGFGFNLNNNLVVDFSAAKSFLHDMLYTGAILTWAINTKR